MTLLKGKTPYNSKKYTKEDENKYWKQEYRFYSEKLFETLFPDLNISFEYDDITMLVKIEKEENDKTL